MLLQDGRFAGPGLPLESRIEGGAGFPREAGPDLFSGSMERRPENVIPGGTPSK